MYKKLRDLFQSQNWTHQQLVRCVISIWLALLMIPIQGNGKELQGPLRSSFPASNGLWILSSQDPLQTHTRKTVALRATTPPSQKSAIKSQTRSKDKEPDTKYFIQNRKPSLAKGIIVKFHRWPKGKDKKRILKRVKNLGFKKVKKHPSFNIWVFEWHHLKKSKIANTACRNLSKMRIIDYCEPNSNLYPNQTPHDTQATGGCRGRKCRSGNNITNLVNKILDVIGGNNKKDLRTCGILTNLLSLKDGKLSDHWAQEMIGTDLLKETIQQTNRPPPRNENFLTVLDSTHEYHTFHVSSLMSGQGKSAVLPEMEKQQVISARASYADDYLNVYESLRPHSAFINNSMGWSRSQTIASVVKKIAENGSIFVVSAGNYIPSLFEDKYIPSPIEEVKAEAARKSHIILVGSLSPHGLRSEFSKEGEEISILAPSDSFLNTGISLGRQPFGGTSGAAPLVTSSLAGFSWISGYHPTMDEVKTLLEKTAIPTFYSQYEKPRQNGVGIINAYKLGRVGLHLREKCKDRENKKLCFQSEIQKEETYLFPEDKMMGTRIEQVFPGCGCEEGSSCSSHRASSSDCENQRETFNQLRREVLLNPSHPQLWKSLSCIYEANGFTENSKGLHILSLSSEKDGANLTALLDEIKEELLTLDRLSHLIKDESLRAGLVSFLLKEAKDPNNHSNSIGLSIAKSVGKIGGKKGDAILQALLASTDNPVLKVRYTMEAGRREEGIAILQTLLESNSSEDLKRSIVEEMTAMGGQEGVDVLRELLRHSPSEDLKQMIAIEAGVLGPEGARILKTFLEDDDLSEVLKQGIVTGVVSNGRLRSADIIKKFLEDNPSEDLKITIAQNFHVSMGRSERINILKTFLENDPGTALEKEIARAARGIGGQEGANILLELLDRNPSNEYLKHQIASEAGLMGGQEGANILRELFSRNPSNESLKNQIASDAGGVGGQEGADILLELFRHSSSNEDFKIKIARAATKSVGLGNLGDQEGANTLRELLRLSPNNEVKSAIAVGAGEVGGQEGANILRELLRLSPSNEVKSAIAVGAGEVGGQEGANILRELLRLSPSNEVKSAIAVGAGEVGGQEGANILRELLLLRPSNRAKSAIAVGAGEVGGQEGADILQGLLRLRPSNEVKSAIVVGAGEVGGQEGADILQGLLRFNPSPSLKNIIAQQAQTLYLDLDSGEEPLRLILQNLSQDKDVDGKMRVNIQEFLNLAENMTFLNHKSSSGIP